MSNNQIDNLEQDLRDFIPTLNSTYFITRIIGILRSQDDIIEELEYKVDRLIDSVGYLEKNVY